MSYKSLGIKADDGFFDIIRILDKIQLRKTSDHLMTSHEVKKMLHLWEQAKEFGCTVYVEFFSCFSVKGFKFKRWCTRMSLNIHGGFISWQEAPERQYGRGDRYSIAIIEPFDSGDNIIKHFPGFTRKDTGAINHLIFTGD